MQTTHDINRPLKFMDTLTVAWEVFKSGLGRYAFIGALMVLIQIIGQLIFFVFSLDNLIIGSLILFVLNVFTFIISVVLTGFVIIDVNNYFASGRQDIGATFNRVFERSINMILTSLLIVVAMIPLLILLVIPGIIFALFAMFAVTISALTGGSPVDNIKKSIDIVNQRILSSFLRILGMAGVLVTVSIPLAIASMIVLSLFIIVPSTTLGDINPQVVGASVMVSVLMTSLINGIWSSILTVFASVFHTTWYLNWTRSGVVKA